MRAEPPPATPSAARTGFPAAPRDGQSGDGAAETAPTPTPPVDDRAARMVASDPPGARIYIDGELRGVTPQTLANVPARATLVLSLSGHRLHRQELTGGEAALIKLEPAEPLAGPAGIKVRCTETGRLHVFLDGQDTGALCPTDRLKAHQGWHEIEIYDPVTDARAKHRVHVEGTRNSARIHVGPPR
jgi:hypothetical protein